MSKTIKVFDTTLRDGEQVPGSQLNTNEKVEIALQLEKLGVDIIEAGFPVSSPTDMRSVKEVSRIIKNSIICALSRGVEKDIDAAYQAIKAAVSPRIHTFLPISHVQMEHVLRKKPEDVLEQISKTVGYARKYVSDVEWSGMDASRADRQFLVAACRAAIKAGANTINITDTVGYSVPEEFGKIVKHLVTTIPEFQEDVTLSVHVHNDLGLATANTLYGILNGAAQVECTVNGIGERAGNCPLEEIVMAIETRYKNIYQTNINKQNIAHISSTVSNLMNVPVQKNKAIVGANAFAHSSGIHQDGILKNRSNFEIIDPKSVGFDQNNIVLTARSGRAALNHHLSRLGYILSKEDLSIAYDKFIYLADSQKVITDDNLRDIIS